MSNKFPGISNKTYDTKLDVKVVGLFLGRSRSHNVTKHVNHSQNGESSVVLVANQPKLLVHSINGGVSDVHPVQESKGEQQAEDRNDPEVSLPDQRGLVDVWNVSFPVTFPSYPIWGSCLSAEGAREPTAGSTCWLAVGAMMTGG